MHGMQGLCIRQSGLWSLGRKHCQTAHTFHSWQATDVHKLIARSLLHTLLHVRR